MKTTLLTVLSLFLFVAAFGQLARVDNIPPPPCDTIYNRFHFSIKGRLTDAQTNKSINGATVTQMGSDGSIYVIKTDSNGVYLFDSTKVHPCTAYIISANAQKYFASQYRAYISTVGLTESRIFIKDFQLQKGGDIADRFFPQCKFNFGSTNALGSLPDSLNYIVKLLHNNPTITIEADGHGSPDEKNAQALSFARASVCRQYLISQGIDSDRIVEKGWGVIHPLPGYGKADIERMKTKEEKIAACEADRRVEFRVLSFTYTPKNKQ